MQPAELTLNDMLGAEPPVIEGEMQQIRIEAGDFHLIFAVGDDKRLLLQLGDGAESTFGALDLEGSASLEPAFRVVHADGNASMRLEFERHSTQKIDDNVTQTRLELRDSHYPLEVALMFRAYTQESVIEQWAEICHSEDGAVKLENFASAAPVFEKNAFFLTYYRGDWADEMNREEEKLGYGLKTIASRFGARAHLNFNPSFLLSLGAPSDENSGAVIGGTFAYSGNFGFQFEVAPSGQLRAICGINSEHSALSLPPDEVLTLPAMIWSYSATGRGELARQFARWGRNYGVREGQKSREILLNNWEATYFDFDEAKLLSLFDGARDLGLELFLLDDGWFGNKYPRDNPKQGLGDWQVMQKKLPQGLGFLGAEAQKRGLRFGIWLEPEMVNPRSELFEEHPDWALGYPGRAPQMDRNQLVLDLSNPDVREWMFETIDGLLSDHPAISYVKWDCNSTITQPHSAYLSAHGQSRLYFEYYRSYYDVLGRIARKHPNVEIMNCSGGGGRVDYGSLRLAHEFWPSDNTDPLRRVAMQWEYAQFFPTNTVSAHVTQMGGRPLKFAFDVAMSARLGMDMDTSKLSDEERDFARGAITTYKRIRDVVQLGDLYRLESPYEGARAAQMNVASDKNRAVAFVWQLKDAETPANSLILQGLDAQNRYLVNEINLKSGQDSQAVENGQVLTGAALMQSGLTPTLARQFESAVVELRASE